MAIRTRRARLRGALAAVAGTAVLAAGCSSSTQHRTTAQPAPAPPAAGTPVPARPNSTCGAGVAGQSRPGPEVNPPGDIPDNQAYSTYRAPAGGYSIQVPEGWARAEQGRAVAFTDKFNSARIELVPTGAVPTPASAQAEVTALGSKATCFQPGKISTVSRRAGSAVLITYRADSPSDPVTGKVVHQDVERYEFWRGGTEAVVSLASPQGSDNVDPWRKITDSFAWAQ